MSWITEIAGKAEKILNKIDHNAAIILKNEGKTTSRTKQDQKEVNSLEEPKEYKSYLQPAKGQIQKTLRASHSTPSISLMKQEDETLIEFLNNSSAVDIDELQSLTMEDSQMNGNTDITSVENSINILELTNENQMLKNEVRSVNRELSLLLNRTKTAEREVAESKEKRRNYEMSITKLEEEIKNLQKKLTESDKNHKSAVEENNRLKELSNSCEESNIKISELEGKFSAEKFNSKKKEESLRADILSLQARLEASERDFARLKKESAQDLEDANSRLIESRAELEQYRSKALKTLNEKDRLISELRKTGVEQISTEITLMELEQLRNEKLAVMEDCEELHKKLESLRAQMKEADERLESIKDEGAAELREWEGKLMDETARRIAAEEHCSSTTEELHSVREELSRQVTNLTLKIRERDSELNRLRAQIARPRLSNNKSQGPSEKLEERISSLTSALVRKQTDLEQVTKDRNELRLQLDQTKNKLRQLISQSQGRTISVNDTDDAKLQVPSFFLESPFDTNVTRRVKRAYSSLDAVSVRTGVFLRRYPLARIFVLCYVVLLHFWVCLVLFSRTPETKI